MNLKVNLMTKPPSKALYINFLVPVFSSSGSDSLTLPIMMAGMAAL